MAEAQPIDLTNTSDEDDPPPKRQREDDPPLTRQPNEDDPPPKRHARRDAENCGLGHAGVASSCCKALAILSGCALWFELV